MAATDEYIFERPSAQPHFYEPMKQQVWRLLACSGSVCITSNLVLGAAGDILTPHFQRQLDVLSDLTNAAFSRRYTSIFDGLVSRHRHDDPGAEDNELACLSLWFFSYQRIVTELSPCLMTTSAKLRDHPPLSPYRLLLTLLEIDQAINSSNWSTTFPELLKV